MSRLLDKIKDVLSLPFIRNTIKLSTSTVLLMFIPIFVTPILSRLYTPEDYAAWGIFSSTYYIISAFIFLSYENSIVKCNDPEDVPNLVALSALICWSITAIIAIVFSIGKWSGFPFFKDFPSILLLVFLLLATTTHKLCGAIANREKRYGIMSVSNILNGSAQASIRVILGFFPLVSYGLLVGNVIAHAITAVFLIICLRDIFFKNDFISAISFREIKRLAVKNKKFPLFDMPARLVEFAMANLTLIILSFFYAKSELGCYSMVVQFILVPITMIGTAMAGVFYREISESNDHVDLVRNTTRQAAKITFVISVIPALFLALGGDKLLVIVLGDKWIAAGKMALCLAVYSVPLILSEPLLPVFRTMDCQELRFKWNLVNLIVSFSALILSAIFIRDMYWVLVIYAICYGGVRFLMYREILRLTDVKTKTISRWFFPVLIGTYFLLVARLVVFVL